MAFDLPSWLNRYAILGLIFVLSCGQHQLPRPARLLSEATYTIYLTHLFFVLAAQNYFPHARGELDPLALLVPWSAGLVGSLLVIALGRALLGGHSRGVIGS